MTVWVVTHLLGRGSWTQHRESPRSSWAVKLMNMYFMEYKSETEQNEKMCTLLGTLHDWTAFPVSLQSIWCKAYVLSSLCYVKLFLYAVLLGQLDIQTHRCRQILYWRYFSVLYHFWPHPRWINHFSLHFSLNDQMKNTFQIEVPTL